MKKILDKIIIILTILSFINSICNTEDEEVAKIRDTDDCSKRSFTDDETNEGAYRCCLVEKEVDRVDFYGTEFSCIALTANDYDKVKDLVDTMEKENGVDDVSIDCNSKYIKFGLLSLSLLLF